MAYADFEFYKGTYYGDLLGSDGASKWLDMASDLVDTMTSGRLVTAFPVEKQNAARVRKAVCAIADALFQVDVHRQATIPQAAQDGSYHGSIASVTSGKESISYSAVGAADSIYKEAASSQEKLYALTHRIATQYLADIPDAKGVNLLYRGV